ncbi:2-phosphosulfolactate phosphatase [Bacillus sp. FJAT-49736]|uniref:2-phosphosulfolactate phosphatase n=1 Tax=Bacillus sp. FJAT-49736 TaxID=2833582 RepID=UPI001BCA2534|nr:2-phosphosulfolactate phosphatase [Bacillus sp. FJAT-49736]MBS4175635.1 2-phosphosulfolactate phosphatase [Bacillus sp. FJAT-49736]
MFDQSPYPCRIEWGARGAREAAERGDIIIVVDILSFSSTVVTAIHHGAIIYPYPFYKDGKELEYAMKVGAELILGRAESIKCGSPTLSPITFNHTHRNNKYVLCSLNGALCSWVAGKASVLLIGSLLNSSAVASYANQLQDNTGSAITIIACGERWDNVTDGENSLRPAIEDYLGAGAILSNVKGELSPEAELCANAFKSVEHRIQDLLWECGSGRELRQKGYEQDVIHASRLDLYPTVPILSSAHFVSVEV